MAKRSLILDANILIRAVLGKRVIPLIADNTERVTFLVPRTAISEAQRHLARLIDKHGIDLDMAELSLDKLLSLVIPLDDMEFEPWRDEAISRIGTRDIDDWPILAAALAIDCPIWTEDRDFFGTGIATWTTDRVELFFRNSTENF